MARTEVLQKPIGKVKEKAREMAEHGKEHMATVSGRLEDYSTPVYMGLALGSIIYSLTLFFRKSKDNAVFVGLWAPTFLALGVFHKLMRMMKIHHPE